MSNKPTEEQSNIISAIKKVPKIKVVAVPGSGKTTLLKMIANQYGSQSVLYLAYNNSIVKEVKSSFPSNTTVKTLHSLAYNWYNPKKRGKELGFLKPIMIKSILKDNKIDYETAKMSLDLLSSWSLSDSATTKLNINEPDFPAMIKLINRVSSKSKFTLNNAKYVVSISNKILSKMRDETKDGIDITHDFYLKEFHLALLKGDCILKYDILMMDEAQDASAITKAIFEAIKAKRKIVVGDPDQQLYSFLGAINALNTLEGYTEFPLTKSWRMPQTIADKASALIRLMKGNDPKIEGLAEEIELSDRAETVAYISRTNAGLISNIIKRLNQTNHEANDWVTCRDPKNIFSIAKDLNHLLYMIDIEKKNVFDIPIKQINNKHLWFFAKEYNELNTSLTFRRWLAREYSHDVEIKQTLTLFSKLADEDLSLSTISNISQKQYKRARAGEKFRYNLTTAHTSKGLEFDVVCLSEDFPSMESLVLDELVMHYDLSTLASADGYLEMFRSMISEGTIKKQSLVDEINLLYVSISRAKMYLEARRCEGLFSCEGVMRSPDAIDATLAGMIAKQLEKENSDRL